MRSIFTLGIEDENKKSRIVATAVPIAYHRKKDIENLALADIGGIIDLREKRLFLGSLVNIRYIPSKSWWLEASTGLAKEILKSKGKTDFTVSRIGCDDIVFSGGYNIFPTQSTQMVFYGLAGFPTRTTITLQEAFGPLVGSRLFGLAIGSEISYTAVYTPLKRSLSVFFQNRFLHFFKRSWKPVLPSTSKIQPGNVIDLLFAAKYRMKKHTFDIGYNPTFFTNQAVIISDIQKIRDKSFVRQSIFASYAYMFKKFPILEKPLVVGAGFLYSRAKRFNTKIFSYWVQLSAIF